jgi:UDP-glucose 4-epimerase
VPPPSVVVLTGASGFIGQRLLQKLCGPHRVRALARRPPTDAGSGQRGVEWRAFDLTAAPSDWEGALVGAMAVVHAAAYVPPNHRDSALAETCFRVNALGTLGLLEAAARAGVRRFVYLSTNIYAVGATATEASPIFPSAHSPHYLLSKACGDIYTLNTGSTGSMQTVCLRLASVYGPGMPSRGLVPTFASRFRMGLPVRVNDGGRWSVDLVHVDDVVGATLSAVTAAVTGPFNIGSGKSVTSLEVARTMAELAGADSTKLEIEPQSPGEPPPGLPALDVSRARQDLRYSPRSLRDGLTDYLASLGPGAAS